MPSPRKASEFMWTLVACSKRSSWASGRIGHILDEGTTWTPETFSIDSNKYYRVFENASMHSHKSFLHTQPPNKQALFMWHNIQLFDFLLAHPKTFVIRLKSAVSNFNDFLIWLTCKFVFFFQTTISAVAWFLSISHWHSTKLFCVVFRFSFLLIFNVEELRLLSEGYVNIVTLIFYSNNNNGGSNQNSTHTASSSRKSKKKPCTKIRCECCFWMMENQLTGIGFAVAGRCIRWLNVVIWGLGLGLALLNFWCSFWLLFRC